MIQIKKLDDYQKNTILNYIVKICGVIISLLSTRVTINYLGNTLYGLWVTIASIVSWMSSGDFGVGNGLRNKYAEAYAEGDQERQKALIATGVTTLTGISLFLLLVGAAICEVLIGSRIIQPEVRIPMYVTVVFFCLNLVLSISKTVSYGQQKSWYVTMTSTGMTFSSLVVVEILKVLGVPANLTLFSIAHGVCSIIPNAILVWILKKEGTDILHSGILRNSNKELRKDIINIGMSFFGIQICSIILYSTDNVIINYLFNSEAVSKYSVITNFYDMGQNMFSIMLIALWSAVTYQAAKNNIDWIRKKVKSLMSIWSIYVCGVIAVSLVFNKIVRLWIGQNAEYYEPALVALFAIYGITVSFSAIFVNVVNGLNKIKLQLVIAGIGAVLNIPLSVFFARYLGMGIFGVKLATFLAAILTAIAIPIQVWYLLNRKPVRSRTARTIR